MKNVKYPNKTKIDDKNVDYFLRPLGGFTI